MQRQESLINGSDRKEFYIQCFNLMLSRIRENCLNVPDLSKVPSPCKGNYSLGAPTMLRLQNPVTAYTMATIQSDARQFYTELGLTFLDNPIDHKKDFSQAMCFFSLFYTLNVCHCVGCQSTQYDSLNSSYINGIFTPKFLIYYPNTREVIEAMRSSDLDKRARQLKEVIATFKQAQNLDQIANASQLNSLFIGYLNYWKSNAIVRAITFKPMKYAP